MVRARRELLNVICNPSFIIYLEYMQASVWSGNKSLALVLFVRIKSFLITKRRNLSISHELGMYTYNYIVLIFVVIDWTTGFGFI